MINRKVKINIAGFFVMLLLILQVKCFWLLPISAFYSINSNQQQILMVIIVLIAIIFLGGSSLNQGCKETKLLIWLFIIYYFIELFVSAVRNNQGLLDAFISSNFYLMLILYFLIMYYFKAHNREDLYKLIMVVSVGNIIVCWLQYLLDFRGIHFTQFSFSASRFGSLRIDAMGETITSLGIIICVVYFLSTKGRKKWLYLGIGIIGSLGNLVVSKGRVTILALFVSVCIIFVSKYKKHAVKTLGTIFLVIIAVIIFLQSSIGQTYLKSMTDIETDTGSVRSREIEYYNEQTEKHLILGVGFIRDNGDLMSDYLKGPAHQYSRTDIGIWGVANALGLVGVVWYILMSLNMILKLRKTSKRKHNGHYLIALGLMTFSIVYIPTMIMLNPYSVTALAILMALVDKGFVELKE